jgi:hypothetical protein
MSICVTFSPFNSTVIWFLLHEMTMWFHWPMGFHGLLGRLDEVVHGSCVVVAGSGGVVDGDLKTVEADVFTRTGCQREGPDEDPAVAALAHFEIQGQDEILPRLLVDHHVAAALMRIDTAILDRSPARLLAARHPSVERLAVKKQQPAIFLLLLRQHIVRGGSQGRDQEHDEQANDASHIRLLSFCSWHPFP